MPVILIVDDSEVDQRLVAGLIEKDKDWILEFAGDGESALAMMETISPDIVLTDLRMPNMDGIELVRQLKTKYPQIPVVLITSQGSETLAVQAIQNGAASYIPKSALADYLMDTIEQILQFAGTAKSQKCLFTCLTGVRFQFKLMNDPNLIRPLIRFVREWMAEQELGDEALRRQTSVAVEEALINAMFHGNLEMAPLDVKAAKREMHAGITSKIVQTRRQETLLSQRRILVCVDFRPPILEFTVRDEGPGFDVKGLPPVEELENISSPKVGRGLTLIAQLMDQIEFNEIGNQIRMSLDCNSCESN